MSAYHWAYHKIVVWALWRFIGIYSPSVLHAYGIWHPMMFDGAGNFRDHRYGGTTLQGCVDYDAILRKAMNEGQR